MLSDRELKWTIKDSEVIFSTPIYDVLKQQEQSGTGLEGEYLAIKASDWVMVVPVIKDNFVMVRQWRHGEDKMTLEFPGGMMDDGENPRLAAERELLEETGYKAGKFTYLGICCPNSALFKNHFHCYLAEDLKGNGNLDLDEDEFLNYQEIPIKDAISQFGTGEFSNALMGAALALYLKTKYKSE